MHLCARLQLLVVCQRTTCELQRPLTDVVKRARTPDSARLKLGAARHKAKSALDGRTVSRLADALVCNLTNDDVAAKLLSGRTRPSAALQYLSLGYFALSARGRCCGHSDRFSTKRRMAKRSGDHILLARNASLHAHFLHRMIVCHGIAVQRKNSEFGDQ